MSDSGADRLLTAIQQLGNGRLAIVTGAGISLASGIPTFRGDDPDAVWKRDITELGTFRFFTEDPVASWRWSLQLFDKVPDAKPNPAHFALARLGELVEQRGGRYNLITQNIDTLHEQAGSQNTIKVHGSVDRVRCIADGGCRVAAPTGSLAVSEVDFAPFRANPSLDTLPRCPECGDLLRRHVLWFDEFYGDHDDYRWPDVLAAARTLDLLIFVGTSFSVGVTDLMAQAAIERGKPAWSIDPSAMPPYPQIDAIGERAEVLLPELVDRYQALGEAGE